MSVAARVYPATDVFARPAGMPSIDQQVQNEDAIAAALRNLGSARRSGSDDAAVRSAITGVQVAARR